MGACVRACVNVSAHVHAYVCVCVLGQSQCCESNPFPPSLPIGVVERLSCIERKVDGLQHIRDLQSAAIEDLQSGQDSQSATIEDLRHEQD